MSTMTTTDDQEMLRFPDAARELGIHVPELSRRVDAAGVQVFVIDGPYRALRRGDLEQLAGTPDPAS